jgi:sec-independent protein translocase protein TatC
MSYGDQDFSEDLFEHTKMSFWDHIEELRAHLWRALIGFFIGMTVGLFVGKQMVVIIARPVERALVAFHEDRRVRIGEDKNTDPELMKKNQAREVTLTLKPDQLAALGQAVGGKAPAEAGSQSLPLKVWISPLDFMGQIAEASEILNKPPTLSTLSPVEAFLVYLKVSMYCGAVISSPWVFYQLWSFVAAGLYPHEKKLVHLYMPVSIGLFLCGVLLCEFVVLPITLGYLLSFNSWMNLEPDLRLSEWLTFAIWFPLVFGLAFQLPLVMLVLHRIGIVDVELYRKHRRLAYFAIACSYVIFGMSPDAFSMLSYIVPLFALYEFGILLCRFSPKPLFDLGEPEEEEMVEA